jgi:hypothetical protein
MVQTAAKRGIVRGLVILPPVLCLFGWAWSYVHTERVCYAGSARDWSAEIAVGELDLWSGTPDRPGSGWTYVHAPPDWEIGELYTGLPDWHLLGAHFFCGAHPYSPGVRAVLLVIPFWVMTIAAGLAPALLWWRARKRPNSRGFPIEGTETGV